VGQRIGRLASRGPEALLAAGVLVGVAIALDGPVSRGLNGVAGILWIVAAVSLLSAVKSSASFLRQLGMTVAICLVLVLAVRPSDLLMAVLGFSIGGALIALCVKAEPERAALPLPALWLPIHLVVAVIKAILRAIGDEPARVRTDPPPTAALVPLAMIVAAYLGGWIVSRLRAQRDRRLKTMQQHI
jgi:uncharacterized membrane protein YccC